MYTGFNWIFLHRNYFGVLHGDVVGKDKKRTRFFYQQTNEPDKKAKEGPAALQVILNAAQEPSDPMEVNVIVLTGHAVEVPISQLSQAGI